MWILQIFKESLNSTFDYLMEKVRGRFLAFCLQLLVSYFAVAVFTFVISFLIVMILNQGEFSLNIFSMDGLFEWVQMIDPVWMVTTVIAVNYFFKADVSKKSISFADFYRKRSSQFWTDVVIGVSILAVVLTFYYKNELMLSFGPDPLQQLLNSGFDGLKSPLMDLLSHWIYYAVVSLPIAAVVLIEVRDRKRNGLKMEHSIWRVIVAPVLLSFIVFWTFDNFLYIFGKLVMNLFYAPFELIEIPVILGIVVGIFAKTLNFMFIAAIFHFAIKHCMENESSDQIETHNTNEL